MSEKIVVANWVEAGKEADVKTSRIRVQIGQQAFALFKLDDGFFALDDICSHEYSRLSEGEVWDDEVYCPKHGSRFDIRTGKVRSLPAIMPVRSYPVKVEDGIIYIDTDVDTDVVTEGS